MQDESLIQDEPKPLAGSCQHSWESQESPYFIAQLCRYCKLLRYKSGLTADWEYRAPIPFAQGTAE
ncbi:MAG TPA: hypothetical protein VFD30_17935 [Terriglobia bacterium]|nr:hypothetical protein [Terriglobia bacterium]